MRASRKLQQFIELKLKGRVPLDIINEAIELVIELDRDEQEALYALKPSINYHEIQAI